ncbi:MAG: GDSL-type esterase/lipase family protein [Myxococcota bacterium]
MPTSDRDLGPARLEPGTRLGSGRSPRPGRARRGLVTAALSVSVACASPTPTPTRRAAEPTPRPASFPWADTTTAPSVTPASSVAASADPSVAPVAPAPPAPAAEGPLGTFYRALADLERGRRRDHVRVAWLGDSHAQADFWPDAIRVGLQRRFGAGGPGFLHVGFKGYRQSRVRFDIRGRWRMRPKSPSTVESWGDGAFGLGGILHAGFADYRAVTVALEDPSLHDKALRWDLCYKHGLDADAFRITLGTEPPETFRPSEDAPVGRLAHTVRRSEEPATFQLRILSGRPDFCGLVVETDVETERPGVVLDNLGINGARYGTALAWNEGAWAQELARRPAPELFIFEYGGNEASDAVVTPERYRQQALELIARARRVRGDASCLVIAPSDRVDAEAKIPPIVAALAEAATEAGCAFWNTYEVMGGRGSLRRWRDDARAAPDGIHLTPKGYAQVGALLLQDLMSDYRRRP